MQRRLRAGMVGGGRGSFIGEVHRMAIRLDDRLELVAGVFASEPTRSREFGAELLLKPARVYADAKAMAAGEAKLSPNERIDFVAIVTPNDTHVPLAKTFLRAGFNVVCDKPLGVNLAEALELQLLVRQTGKVFVLTHNYTGYGMVKEARALVAAGNLGAIRKVVVEYAQGWMAQPLPEERATGCLADIGSHAENLARYITGLHLDELCAEFTSFVPGRPAEDDANLLLRYRGGAKGILSASQISIGEENALSIRVYGSEAALEWKQESPNELILKNAETPRAIRRPGNNYLSAAAKRVARIPAGHPEGFIEAFANIYLEAARAIAAEVLGEPPPRDLDFPTIDDAVEGMAFLEAASRSAAAGGAWTGISLA